MSKYGLKKDWLQKKTAALYLTLFLNGELCKIKHPPLSTQK